MKSEEEVTKYINLTLTEQYLMQFEQNILEALKLRQEKYPSDYHDHVWLEYSDFILERRKNIKF